MSLLQYLIFMTMATLFAIELSKARKSPYRAAISTEDLYLPSVEFME